jgi:arylsulfatase A-like enzyme
VAMSDQKNVPYRRVLIIGTDGLRPDSVDPVLMPTCAKLMERGTLFTSFHAAFPSETRVSMTTLTTGVYPGRHGVVGNLMYIQGYNESGFFQTGDHRDVLAYSHTMSEPLVLHPTLGDRLHQQGKRLAIAASSSPGASLLWNLNHPELVINPATTYGVIEMEELHRQVGDIPEKRQSGNVAEDLNQLNKERTLWATRALIDIHLQNDQNPVMVLWLTEPDGSQHSSGIGSPVHKEALRLVDSCVAEVLEAIELAGLSEEIDIMWISDHGHSTLEAKGSLREFIHNAAEALGLRSKFIIAGNYIYVEEEQESTFEEIVALIGWLQAQDWCGLIFAGDEKYSSLLGVLSLETLFGPITHERAPLLVIQPKWDSEPNEYGVHGRVHSLTTPSKLIASHGTVSPYDLHAFCLGVGSSFKKGHVTDIACGIVDITPTVCHLIGLSGESGFDGRVLAEGLEPELVDGQLSQPEETKTEVGNAQNSAGIRLIDVNGTRYLEGYVK